MKCDNCNGINDMDAKFCVHCGKEFIINNNEKKSYNPIILIVVVIFLIAISISFFNTSNIGYKGVKKLERYISRKGFKKEDTNIYTLNKKGYTYTFDFSKELFSMSNSDAYAAYYYKQNKFGASTFLNNRKITLTYDFNNGSYNCDSSKEVCSYVRNSVITLGQRVRETFEEALKSARVDINDL